MLQAFTALVLELFTGVACAGAPGPVLRAAVQSAELPFAVVRAVLLACVPEGTAPLPAASELLESVLLDSRRFWGGLLNAASALPPAVRPSADEPGESSASNTLARTLERRFSTMDTTLPRVASSPRPPRVASSPALRTMLSLATAAIAEIDSQADFRLGRLKGLDYVISVTGTRTDFSCIDFTMRLEREQSGADSAAEAVPSHLVRFPFDLFADTVDQARAAGRGWGGGVRPLRQQHRPRGPLPQP